MTFESTRRVPKPHHNFVPEYQMSGIPFVKSVTCRSVANAADLKANISDYKLEFPTVTRWIKLHNHDDAQKTNVKIYFSETAASEAFDMGGDSHYYLLDIEEVTERLELKCKHIYIVPTETNKTPLVSIIAGLTSVPAADFPDQTKENGFSGIED